MVKGKESPLTMFMANVMGISFILGMGIMGLLAIEQAVFVVFKHDPVLIKSIESNNRSY